MRKAEVFIWPSAPSNGSTGHVALTTNKYYVSLWPDLGTDNTKTIVYENVVENKTKGKLVTPQEDTDVLGTGCERYIFTTLNEDAINQAIEKIQANKHQLEWDIRAEKANCASIVLALLEIGGIRGRLPNDAKKNGYERLLDYSRSSTLRLLGFILASLSMTDIGPNFASGVASGYKPQQAGDLSKKGGNAGLLYGGVTGYVIGTVLVAPVVVPVVAAISPLLGIFGFLATVVGGTAAGAVAGAKIGSDAGQAIDNGIENATPSAIQATQHAENEMLVISPYNVHCLVAAAEQVEAQRVQRNPRVAGTPPTHTLSFQGPSM